MCFLHIAAPTHPSPAPAGEALVGHAKVLYADEVSTGLDSNTTFTIARSLRNYCHVMKVGGGVGGGRAKQQQQQQQQQQAALSSPPVHSHPQACIVRQQHARPPPCRHRPVSQATMLVALLQPAPETFELFDDVVLLASGMVGGDACCG